MPDIFHRGLFLDGPAGKLEAMLWTSPLAHPPRAALICHPHPLFGGTMHNKVVFQAAKALHQLGIPVLRFNFRGAGLSEGEHDNGIGEQDDVRVALDYLAQEFPGTPILLAGFSFGSRVGLKVGCEDQRVAELVGVGVPTNNVLDDLDRHFLHRCQKPKLVVQGSEDEFGPRPAIEELFAAMPEPKKLVFVDGADHFLKGKLDQLGSAIDLWLTPRLWPAGA
jgi:alpha/beta superfamily hydrolase